MKRHCSLKLGNLSVDCWSFVHSSGLSVLLSLRPRHDANVTPPVNGYIQWLISCSYNETNANSSPVYVTTSFDGHLRTECDFQVVVQQPSTIVESRKNQEIKPHNRSPWSQPVGTQREEGRQEPGFGLPWRKLQAVDVDVTVASTEHGQSGWAT